MSDSDQSHQQQPASPVSQGSSTSSESGSSTPSTPSTAGRQPPPGMIDPRGPRFVAAVTTVVLAAVLLSGQWWLLALQALVFATAVVFGLRRSPYSILYARLLRPRLGPPGELEDETPPRFAQGVGLVFATVGAVAYLTGATTLGAVAAGLAFIAAFMNAAFGLCIGCEAYLLGRRALSARPHRSAESHQSTSKEASA